MARAGRRLTRAMPEYLLELYVSPADAYLAAGDGRSIREAADELARRGAQVRYRRSIFVPADETCFVLLEADSIEEIHDVTRLANVPCDRVSQAVSHPVTRSRTHKE
jgi:hypothetical protein